MLLMKPIYEPAAHRQAPDGIDMLDLAGHSRSLIEVFTLALYSPFVTLQCQLFHLCFFKASTICIHKYVMILPVLKRCFFTVIKIHLLRL